MAESQNIEYKESWRDEYLKWICGFANAQGGKLYIGIDDKSNVVGVDNAKKLLEDIPNKIRDTMGLMPQVNLLNKDGLEYLEIVTEPSSFPVSYRGEYHYRSGSTKQQLKGNALTQFLLKKTGLSWDSSEVNGVGMEVMSENAFDIFREHSVLRRRMTKEDISVPDKELFEKLNLFTEDGKLTKAGYLLFAKDPNKKVFNSYIKVGYFEGAEILYQDEVTGSLFSQAENCVNLIFTKYLKATITYEGVHRVETFPFPLGAIREAVYNSIVHRAYSYMNPTQIRVYCDKIIISNDATVLDDWSHDKLMSKHKSVKYNPLIADAFFKGGYIETWGRGIEKICNACKENGNPMPHYEVTPSDVTVIFDAVPGTGKDGLIHKVDDVNVSGSGQVRDKFGISSEEIIKLMMENPQITLDEVAEKIDITRRAVEKNVKQLREADIIKRQGSNKNGYWEVLNKGNNSENAK